VVSAAFRFAGSVAVMNNGQEGNAPISKATTLLVDFLDTNSMLLAETGLSETAILPNQEGALF
jgi:hypothetical protein